MSNLDTAIALATEQHAGQVDKAGQAYIQHPLKVMAKLQDEDARIVAVLHDILEDTSTTAVQLRQLGFAKHLIVAIEALTKSEGEHRFQAMQRTARNALACQVKLADLSDNMDLSRLPSITEKDQQRLQQYQVVFEYLTFAQQCHHYLAQYQVPSDYPAFEFTEKFNLNYQYLLNLDFDVQHALGAVHIGLAQEWWILFEDVGHYLAECQHQAQQPDLNYALQLILMTAQEFFDGAFADADTQILFKNSLQHIFAHFFDPNCHAH